MGVLWKSIGHPGNPAYLVSKTGLHSIPFIVNMLTKFCHAICSCTLWHSYCSPQSLWNFAFQRLWWHRFSLEDG